MNIVELAHALDILEKFSSRRIVDGALRSANLDRAMFESGTGFIPYAAEAIILEFVARAIGDRLLGAKVGQAFNYSAYGAYADFVLGAPDLAMALDRGRRALSLTHPGSEVVLRRTKGHILVGRDSKGLSVIGHRHLDEAALPIICKVVRHFLGDGWRPDWFEVPAGAGTNSQELADLLGAPVRMRRGSPAVAIRLTEVTAKNPGIIQANHSISLNELASLMGVEPVVSVADVVLQMLHALFPASVPSEDMVAHQLATSPRTLQRALDSEGTSFRELRAKFLNKQAQELLRDPSLRIDRIAKILGYKEAMSFRRAFKAWTGLSPSDFRMSIRQDQ